MKCNTSSLCILFHLGHKWPRSNQQTTILTLQSVLHRRLSCLEDLKNLWLCCWRGVSLLALSGQSIIQEQSAVVESVELILGLRTIAAALCNNLRCCNSKLTHKQMEEPVLVLRWYALAPVTELRNAEAQSGLSSFTTKVVGGAWEVACSRPGADFSETSI